MRNFLIILCLVFTCIQCQQVSPKINQRVQFNNLVFNRLKNNTLELDKYFEGYNLSYTLLEQTDVQVIDTILKESSGQTKRYISLQNSLDQKRVAGISYNNGTFSVDVYDQSQVLPSLQQSVQISQNVTDCYDLAWIDQNQFVLDCSYSSDDIHDPSLNRFVWVDLSNQTVQMKTIDNQIVFNSTVFGRKVSYSQSSNQLARGSAFGLQKLNQSYIELYDVNTIQQNITFQSQIDKDDLNVDVLQYADFGFDTSSNFYILNRTNSIFLINKSSVRTFSVPSAQEVTQLDILDHSVAVLGQEFAYEIDFSKERPQLISKYQLMNEYNRTQENVFLTSKFVIVESTLNNDQQNGSDICVYRRGESSLVNVKSHYLTSPNSYLVSQGLNDSFTIFGQQTNKNYKLITSYVKQFQK